MKLRNSNKGGEGEPLMFIYLSRHYPVAELRLLLPEPELLYQWPVDSVFPVPVHSQVS